MRVLVGREAAKAVESLRERYSVVDAPLERKVSEIVGAVRSGGDRALRKFAESFDGLSRNEALQVPDSEISDALKSVAPEFLKALKHAARNIRRFAEWQRPKPWMRTMQPGVRVGHKVEPLTSVGCFVPAGRYQLPSSLLMTVIPAQVAGVTDITVCSPRPAKETLAAAALLGVKRFYRIGGAQAIAAMAYGTESITRVNKIVGPGNSYVTGAKKLVAFDCAIDMLAGPTEIVYVAEKGDAELIASDLVAQAEHDPETLAILVTTREKLAREVARVAESMSADNEIAKRSLGQNGVALVAKNSKQAMEWANALGGEHITVPSGAAKSVRTAGSVFVGPHSAQSLGDYISGPNHVLPTGNVARYRGGLSVLDFLKIITVQEVSKAGLKRIGRTVITLAEAEGLKAHAESVRVRLR
jgi:histidinol dehydrogenase